MQHAGGPTLIGKLDPTFDQRAQKRWQEICAAAEEDTSRVVVLVESSRNRNAAHKMGNPGGESLSDLTLDKLRKLAKSNSIVAPKGASKSWFLENLQFLSVEQEVPLTA